MKRYAQIVGNRVLGVSMLAGVVNRPDMIELPQESGVRPGDVYGKGLFTRPAVTQPRLIQARKLWRLIPVAEQVALLDSAVPVARAFKYEIELLNAAGDLVDLDHERFVAGVQGLESAGILSAATVAALSQAV